MPHPEGWEPWRPGASAPLPGLRRVVGHRGAALHAPENTLSAIRRAHALGARWVEIDVKLTGDGHAILMHDDTLDRTTDARGPVALTTLARLRGVDAGARFGAKFAGEPVPTFTAAVELLLQLGMSVNVEIKPCKGREVETGQAVARAISELWPLHGPPLLVSSFARGALAASRAVAPTLPLGLLVERIPRNWAVAMQAFGCTTLHPWYFPTRRVTVRDLARQGVPLLFYTVNDPTRASRLLEAGARAIITDAPDRILPIAQG